MDMLSISYNSEVENSQLFERFLQEEDVPVSCDLRAVP